MVYPPPPRISRGRFCFLMKLTHSAWPEGEGRGVEREEGRKGVGIKRKSRKEEGNRRREKREGRERERRGRKGEEREMARRGAGRWGGKGRREEEEKREGMEGRRKMGRKGSTQHTSDCLNRRHELWEDRQTSTSQPLRERLKHPSLSPDSESAPHCRTTAFGRYTLRTCSITLGEGRGGEGKGENRQRNSCFSQSV